MSLGMKLLRHQTFRLLRRRAKARTWRFESCPMASAPARPKMEAQPVERIAATPPTPSSTDDRTTGIDDFSAVENRPTAAGQPLTAAKSRFFSRSAGSE